MIESLLFQELKAEWTQEATIEAKIEGKIEARIEDVMTILVNRFGSKAEALETKIRAIDDEARLNELLLQAATSQTLDSFRKHLAL